MHLRQPLLLLLLAVASTAHAQPAVVPPPAPAPVALTSTRAVFTMREPVEFSVQVPAVLTVKHSDGSTLSIPVSRSAGSTVGLVEIRPGALKPGLYTASVGTATGVPFTIARADNPNAFWLGAWHMGNPDAATLQQESGWWYYSGNLLGASVRVPKPGDVLDDALAARIPAYSETVMGGGHQLDLQQINDWGDPWVQRAVLWKMGLATLSNRMYPSMGIHAFDEPGLTWWNFPAPHVANPYAIPTEIEQFKRDTGKDMPLQSFDEAMPYYHDHINDFMDFVQYRLRFLNQAWIGSKWAVDTINPRFVTINQLASAYATGDVADGVDSTMNQAYDVLSGHGGYSDWAGSFGAVIAGESSHGFAWTKPHIYLPMWITADYTRMRQEMFLPWSIKEEGLMVDPNHHWDLSGDYADVMALLELSEVNHRMAKVGDVIEKLPRSLQPVAVLQSSRQYAFDMVQANYPKPSGATGAYQNAHTTEVQANMRRVMSTGRMPNWLDETEVSAKGAPFLKQWKVVYCPGLTTAAPEFRKAIEGFIAAGGKFIQNKSDALQIPGSITTDYAYTGGNDRGHNPKGELTNDLFWRQYQIEQTPTFATDLNGWLGKEDFRSNAPLNAMLMTVHRAGPASYVLMGNDSQDPKGTRNEQHDPVSLDTTLRVPANGIIYDLFNGGRVPVTAGVAPLHLGPGDGACWLHLPANPGPPRLSVRAEGDALVVDVQWGSAGYLPFRLSFFDPAGNEVDHLFRATSPGRGVTEFGTVYSIGHNSAPGQWTVRLNEWLNGTSTQARVAVQTPSSSKLASSSGGPVSIYLDDATKIRNLFDGKGLVPPYPAMSIDLPRVMNLDKKHFAVFGPDDNANQIAVALRAKGMAVDVNPKYEALPFVREPNHGGTGPVQDNWSVNFENIYANAIVLPGNDLLKKSFDRGHINRPVSGNFPGPGRAYIQWGIGGYQAGYEDVWAFGDLTASTNWMLSAIKAANLEPVSPVTVTTQAAAARRITPAATLKVASQVNVADTPVGTAISPDGHTTYVVLAGGEVAAYDQAGKQLWLSHPLLQGGAVAVSPKADRIVVGGFPGLVILNAADGKTIGSGTTAPAAGDGSYRASRIVSVAWNDAGDTAAGAWVNQWLGPQGIVGPTLGVSLISSAGAELTAPKIADRNVLGVRFVPGSNTLLVGGDSLTAWELPAGNKKWSVKIGAAQAFDFSADGTTCAAGGWGNNAAVINLADGKVVSQGTFENHIGGVALLPDKTLAVAVWGKTRPLYHLAADGKVAPLFQSRFSFHKVLWSPAWNAIVAGEEGGDIWLLNADGTPKALLRDAGTTPIDIIRTSSGVLVSRYDRSIQHLTAP